MEHRLSSPLNFNLETLKPTFDMECDFLDGDNSKPDAESIEQPSLSNDSFLMDEDLQAFREKRVPENTLRKQKWAIALFDRWYAIRNRSEDQRAHVKHVLDSDIDEEELSKILAKFVAEVQPAKSTKPFTGKVQHILYVHSQHFASVTNKK